MLEAIDRILFEVELDIRSASYGVAVSCSSISKEAWGQGACSGIPQRDIRLKQNHVSFELVFTT